MADQFSTATEYLAKRWPLVVAAILIIVGVAKTQFVQNAQAEEMKDIKLSLSELAEIKAEWPYLKAAVNDIKVSQEKQGDKLDKILARVSA